MTGTLNAATVIDKMTGNGDFGTIEVGNRADLIPVNTNPLESFGLSVDLGYALIFFKIKKRNTQPIRIEKEMNSGTLKVPVISLRSPPMDVPITIPDPCMKVDAPKTLAISYLSTSSLMREAMVVIKLIREKPKRKVEK